MLTNLRHLALEVKYLARAREFYVEAFGLTPARETDTEIAFRVGETTLVLRRPRSVPRGGLHVHYAFAAPRGTADEWRRRLGDRNPEETSFGSYRSLYVDDPDDHCVEVGDIVKQSPTGSRDTPGDGVDGTTGADDLVGVFEVVLEVEDLARAEARYAALGFDPVDRGEERRRVRLRGPFDLELWEPQLGLADARGGVHVDLGFDTTDPEAAVAALAGEICGEATPVDADGRRGLRVREADGHYLTFVPDAA